MVTQAAAEAIRKATLIYGSGRAIELAAQYITENCRVSEIQGYKHLRELPDEAVLLSTGDPMLAGLGYLGGEVIPGISSMQVAFAHLGISLTRGVVVNAHAREHLLAGKQVVDEVQRGHVAFVIADPELEVAWMASLLRDSGVECRIALCEKLGYPDERLALGTAVSPPEVEYSLLVLVFGVF